jgi:hypothetical protein
MFKKTICILFTTALLLVVVNTVYAEQHKDVQSLRYEFEDSEKVEIKKPVPTASSFSPILPVPNCDCSCKPVVFAPIERGYYAPRPTVVVYSNICQHNTYYNNDIHCVKNIRPQCNTVCPYNSYYNGNVRCIKNTRPKCVPKPVWR